MILKKEIFHIENLKYLYDLKGNLYRIPNWCFNDPYFQKEYKEVDQDLAININIVISETYTNKTFNLAVHQLITGYELKEKIKDYLIL